MNKISLKDALGVLTNLLRPSRYLDNQIKDFFTKQFKGDFMLVSSGEDALQALIEDFDLKNSEIILPSFICSDVFTRVFARNNITPKIVDCTKSSFNITVENAKKELTSKTKAILIVHTLGVPCAPEEFRKFCDKHNLLLIEDCAHCISLKFKNKYLGSYGDASIFSFAKEMPNFAGGLYLNNKLSISANINHEVNRYYYNRFSLAKLFHKFAFSRILPSKKSNPEPINTRHKQNSANAIHSAPKLSKAIFCYYIPRLNVYHKRKMALNLYDAIKKHKLSNFEIPLSKKEINLFSGKSFPLLVKNRELILKNIMRAGLNPGIGWTPVFSENTEAKNLWNMKKTPNAKTYSDKLLTISLDEVNNSNIKKILSSLEK